MFTSKRIRLRIIFVLGVVAGILYGWVVDPVEYTDVTPGILREDYRADYVLMVAEAYHGDYDTNAAARRLAVLGSASPADTLSATLEYARGNKFSQQEISMLQELFSAMQAYQPGEGISP
ncbi:MAG: hypothetical protein FJZ87_08980 [Chloroflexi bacterium]|nr:hypothetical protein [Chloroflexota bacterium]